MFLAKWRNDHGVIARKPYRTSAITRESFAAIRFDTLSVAEVLNLWETHETLQAGEIMWWKAETAPERDDSEK